MNTERSTPVTQPDPLLLDRVLSILFADSDYASILSRARDLFSQDSVEGRKILASALRDVPLRQREKERERLKWVLAIGFVAGCGVGFLATMEKVDSMDGDGGMRMGEDDDDGMDVEIIQ